MLRFIVKEVDVTHVVRAGGQPETRLISCTDHESLELFLRYEDCPGERQPDYCVRELLGVELVNPVGEEV